ncbi:hypothetical protein E5Q_05482 [Mixia osmundae IAM 14324]|uniref:Uncharacterized protein n=2 Tax=Mixia osmundae (strain CBS 9802 / IAM 14324 / JCM 22182 / KY 12970) TaxID=764103 RepID=G7E7I4_MIXOS|nr:hypothetical protein E5Q_05482 [Mixia osmundae IAM 14324]
MLETLDRRPDRISVRLPRTPAPAAAFRWRDLSVRTGLYHHQSRPSQRDLGRNSVRARQRRIAFCTLRAILILLILAGTIASYIISASLIAQELDEQRRDLDRPLIVINEGINGASSAGFMINPVSLVFLHIIFIVIILVETYIAWAFTRALAWMWMPAKPRSTPQANSAEAKMCSASKLKRGGLRILVAIYGHPPVSARRKPRLPTYDVALRQPVNHARRIRRDTRALQMRGIDIEDDLPEDTRTLPGDLGTGDCEDLELERLRRMGGVPPAYHTRENRHSTLLLAGPQDPRLSGWRHSLLSIFSIPTDREEDHDHATQQIEQQSSHGTPIASTVNSCPTALYQQVRASASTLVIAVQGRRTSTEPNDEEAVLRSTPSTNNGMQNPVDTTAPSVIA